MIGGTSRFGPPSGATSVFRQAGRTQNVGQEIWFQTGMVPDKVPEAPQRMLQVNFPSGVSVRPNDTFTTGLVSKGMALVFHFYVEIF